MTFALVETEPGACGPGCSAVILAEGVAVAGTAAAFDAFMKTIAPRRPPVIIHSQGGLIEVAMALGRLIRRHGLTTQVGEIDRTGGPRARLRPGGACHGACLYVFAGGTSRAIGEGGTLSVSAIQYRAAAGGDLPEGRRQRLTANTIDRIRTFFAEMGLNTALAERLDGTQGPGFVPNRGDLEHYRIVTGDRRA